MTKGAGMRFAADKIEHMPIDSLVPYARNARTHSAEQVGQIAESIREFGFANPVLIRGDGTIIAGHGRVMAAKHLGMADVPCIRLAHLTEAQARTFTIVENRVAEKSAWDADVLAIELGDLGGQFQGLDDLLEFDLSEIEPFQPSESIDPDAHAAESAPDAEPEGRKRTVFPVLVSLSASQFRAWEAMKRETGLADDALFAAKVFA